MNCGRFGVSSPRDNPKAATRVVEAAHETFKMLAANPGLGHRRWFNHPRLYDIRSRRVSGYKNYLIFYRGITNGVQVHHVYHGARDIEALFGGSERDR